MGIDPYSLIVYFALVVLSMLASKYFMSKSQSPQRDKQRATTLTDRGAYTPYMIGRKRVGPIVAWAGKRATYVKKMQTMYQEEAWHVLALGPGKRLWRIYEANKVIWEGPITPTSDPSGSTVITGGAGRFEIYWGEEMQPVNLALGTAKRVGISSRWPFLMYVHWHPKELGPSAFWPAIEYEIEVDVQNPRLTQSQAYRAGTFVLSGVLHPVISPVSSGVPGVGFITVAGHHASRYRPSRRCQITAPNPAAGQYTVRNSVNITTKVAAGLNAWTYVKTTTIWFNEVLTGVTATGSIEVYTDPTDDGYNPVHMVHQLLFDQWPHGLELDRARFSIPSFEEAGVTLEDEDFPGHLLVQDGEEVGSALSGINQDIGAFMPFDTVLGLFRLHLLRNELNVLTLPEETVLNPFPEIENLLREQPVSSVTYIYQDRARKYKDSTVSDDDDGTASQLLHKKQGKADLRLVTDSVTAVAVVERRKQEERAQGAAYKVQCNRGARAIFPGQVVFAPDIEPPLRVSEVKTDVATGKVELRCFTDFYGVPQTEYLQDPGKITDPEDVEEEDSAMDEAAGMSEPPPLIISPEGNESSAFLPPSTLPMMALRIRNESGSAMATLFVSMDGQSYVPATTVPYVAGGALAGAYAYGDSYEEEGFELEELGPDFKSTFTDLTDAPERWRLGEQLVLLGREWLFVRGWEMTGASTWRALGVLRGRFGSEPVGHADGDVAYLLRAADLSFFKHMLVQADRKVWFKIQPDGVDLAAVPALSLDLALIKPRAPIGFRQYNGLTRFDDGDDLHLRWGYFHAMEANVGAGLQPAGAPVPTPTPNGSFFLEVWDPGGPTLLRQISCIKYAEHTYTAEQMTADFGGAPASVLFKIKHVVGSAASELTELTLTKR